MTSGSAVIGSNQSNNFIYLEAAKVVKFHILEKIRSEIEMLLETTCHEFSILLWTVMDLRDPASSSINVSPCMHWHQPSEPLLISSNIYRTPACHDVNCQSLLIFSRVCYNNFWLLWFSSALSNQLMFHTTYTHIIYIYIFMNSYYKQ